MGFDFFLTIFSCATTFVGALVMALVFFNTLGLFSAGLSIGVDLDTVLLVVDFFSGARLNPLFWHPESVKLRIIIIMEIKLISTFQAKGLNWSRP